MISTSSAVEEEQHKTEALNWIIMSRLTDLNHWIMNHLSEVYTSVNTGQKRFFFFSIWDLHQDEDESGSS